MWTCKNAKVCTKFDEEVCKDRIYITNCLFGEDKMNEDQLFDLFYQNREMCPNYDDGACRVLPAAIALRRCSDERCPIFFWIKLLAQEIN